MHGCEVLYRILLMDIVIDDLRADQTELIRETAQLLVDAFVSHTPSYADMQAALDEVNKSFEEDRISRVALLDGHVVGWIGGIRDYHGHVYELHPLAVAPRLHGQGIGRMLVRDLERIVYERGANTLWLGCDDENGRTTLSRCDLYDRLPERIATIRNLKQHPFEFYQRMGFSIIGVLPDANGPGKPDIFMAKRILFPPA